MHLLPGPGPPSPFGAPPSPFGGLREAGRACADAMETGHRELYLYYASQARPASHAALGMHDTDLVACCLACTIPTW
jgi:hypothetical protein